MFRSKKASLNPQTDDPSQNSQLHNATRKQGVVKPEDYPEKDRRKGSITQNS
ncbi:hypothetical protein GGR19_002615 [Croceicoccus naphthovorans]|nr:hypothetical protein [Croceicoccus naphthovorans]